MKTNIDVSIAGIAFLLEPEAFRQLKEYLVRIELGFKENPDGAEILADIEARIAELILSEQESTQVVTEAKVAEIIEQLGLPDGISPVADLEYEEGDEPADRMTRRLYRNPEGKMIGGVCSGLATYFNVDPTMVRLIFILPLFLGFIPGLHVVGMSVVLYILMWVVLPNAKTPRQKLEMKGGKITAQSIQATLRDEFSSPNSSPKHERASSVLAELVYVLGRVALFGIKVLAIFIGLVLAFTVLVVLVTLIGVLFGGVSLAGSYFYDMLPAFTGISPVALAILVALVCLLPLLAVAYMLLALIFKLPKRQTTLTIIMSIWGLILIYSTVMVIRNFDKIKEIPAYIDASDDNWLRLSWDSDDNCDDSDRLSRPERVLSDTVRVESIQIDGATVTDTVKVEYYQK